MSNAFVLINDKNELEKINLNLSSIGNNLNFNNNFIIQGNINIKESLDTTKNANIGGTLTVNGASVTSDDRIKSNKDLLVNSIKTLNKLKPQIYDKQYDLDTENYNITKIKEAGLIAQEVYYEAPELRHLVMTNSENIKELEKDIAFSNIKNDIDYVKYGWNPKEKAGIKYTELIPYLIKGFQEQNSEIENLKKQNKNQQETIDSLIERLDKLIN